MNNHHDKVQNVDPEHKAFETHNLETVEEHNRGEQAVPVGVVHLAVVAMDMAAAPMAALESRALLGFAANHGALELSDWPSAEDASAAASTLTLLFFQHD